MTLLRVLPLVLLALVTGACGSGHAHRSSPPAMTGPVWTSPAEPSPPGDTGR